MRKLVFSLVLLMLALSPALLKAQDANEQPIRIVFQLTSGDTLAHKGLMKQLRNIQKADATAQIEVVCHGPGIGIVVASQSTVKEQLSAFIQSGVVFDVCQNTMTEKNISTEELIKGVQIVPAGIIHVVKRQTEGWSYIKAGF